LADVTDEYLKKRLASLGSSPLDAYVREAGVVLEDRLRQASGTSDKSLTGVSLVDAALSTQTGTLIFSSHPSEQEGARFLYRGAIQYIRNPPVHNLMEYQASMARTLIRLTDSLLKLLAEVPSGKEVDVKLRAVHRMLTRIPIPEAQRLSYKALYEAADKGLTGNELLKAIQVRKQQLAGVLGALGLRISGAEGLENRGAIKIIFDIGRTENGDYVYRTKPILRKALEQEHID
jgi:hypothetical protein